MHKAVLEQQVCRHLSVDCSSRSSPVLLWPFWLLVRLELFVLDDLERAGLSGKLSPWCKACAAVVDPAVEAGRERILFASVPSSKSAHGLQQQDATQYNNFLLCSLIEIRSILYMKYKIMILYLKHYKMSICYFSTSQLNIIKPFLRSIRLILLWSRPAASCHNFIATIFS